MNFIPFFKMSGSGNDFIIIDNRDGKVKAADLSGFAAKVCRRAMSVGADGLILVENTPGADFRWRFFNADGSAADMCGNGARCVARFAYLNGIAGPEMRFETNAGTVSARVLADSVRLNMTDPGELKTAIPLPLKDRVLEVDSINTGVPHVVVQVDDVQTVDVTALGREIRFHDAFAPAGANVNFVDVRSGGHLAIRTYERGVENETLACGTGSVAAAITAAVRHGWASPIAVKTRGGGLLTISFSLAGGRFTDVRMEGDARVVYSGQLTQEAWDYP